MKIKIKIIIKKKIQPNSSINYVFHNILTGILQNNQIKLWSVNKKTSSILKINEAWKFFCESI